MPLPGTAERLQDTAALWSIRAARAQAVVTCACDALIAGLDSPSLRILAGLTRSEADYEVPEILPAALAELGLVFYPPGDPAGQEAGARALAAQAVSGIMTTRELAAAIHQYFGHTLPLAERLASLADEYDMGAYSTLSQEQIGREVMAEAYRLLGERPTHRTAQKDRLSAEVHLTVSHQDLASTSSPAGPWAGGGHGTGPHPADRGLGDRKRPIRSIGNGQHRQRWRRRR